MPSVAAAKWRPVTMLLLLLLLLLLVCRRCPWSQKVSQVSLWWLTAPVAGKGIFWQ
jgi:hypothetical protein